MKYSKILTITAASFLVASNSQALSTVRSTVRAEVKEAIPGSMALPSSRIDYPEPGKINLRSVQYCGDGDVAKYAQLHKDWNWANKGPLPFTLGYWVAPADNSLPTDSNYFSLGTGTLEIGASYISKFTQFDGKPDVEMLPAAVQAVKRIAALRSYRMQASAQATDNFRLFTGVMMCKEIKNPATVSTDPAKVSAEMGNLIDKIESRAPAALAGASSWGNLNSDFKIKISKSGDTIVTEVGSGGSVGLDGELANLGKSLFEFAKPTVDSTKTPAEQLVQYRNAMSAASFNNNLSQLVSDLASKPSCNQVWGVNPKEKWAWEPFALQLTCAALNKGEPGNLAQRVKELLSPESVPSDSDFKAKKEAVLAQLLAGALVQESQASWEGQHGPLPKQRCFSSTGGIDYIDQIMQSAVININNTGEVEYTSIHPEGFFAIGGDKPYRESDLYTIFGMTKANDSFGLNIQRGTANTIASTYMPSSSRLNFKVRGIGCSINIYCMNTHGR